jgi:hypothetical protein
MQAFTWFSTPPRRLAAAVAAGLLLSGAGAVARHRWQAAAGTVDPTAAAFGLDSSAQHAVVGISVDGKHCSGALVAPNAILTARHCVEGRRRIQVAFGLDAEHRERRRVAHVELHPSLDAALVFLRDAAPSFSRPLSWGAALVAPASPGTALLAGTASAGATPQHFVEGRLENLADEVVVSYAAGGLCKGDSGAPLFAREASGDVALVGILRGGAGVCTGPDAFVRVDRLAPWLEVPREALGTDSKQRGTRELVHENR